MTGTWLMSIGLDKEAGKNETGVCLVPLGVRLMRMGWG